MNMIRSLIISALFCYNHTLMAEEELQPPKQNWSFTKVTGTFDRGALQRGFQVYREVCAACHGLDHIRFGKLKDIGFSEDQAKAVAKSNQISTIDDEGNVVQVPATLVNIFASPFANEKAARATNNGSLPPDLSLIVKARKYGADYIYAVLTSFRDPPKGFKLSSGMYFNLYFPGHQIAMPPPLHAGSVTFADKTPSTVSQMAHDVVTFLAWASEPESEARKRMGIKVILFLTTFAGMLYVVMRRTWKSVKGH